MSKNRVQTHSKFLKQLCGLNCNKKLIKLASKDQINAICEVCHNINKRNLELTSNRRNKLRPYRKQFHKLCCKKVSLKQKRTILSQKGGILPALVPILTAAVGNLVGEWLRN